MIYTATPERDDPDFPCPTPLLLFHAALCALSVGMGTDKSDMAAVNAVVELGQTEKGRGVLS